MAEQADPVTFEEARSEFTREREEEGEEPFFAGESGVKPDEQDLEDRVEELESFLRTSPERLTRARGRPKPVPKQRLDPLRDLLVDVNVSQPDVVANFEGAEDQLDFLESIAQSNISIMQTLSVLADTQVEMLQTTFDISDFLAPFSNITVSGTNDIEDADTAEPVVPQSDTTSIPTRVLFVKAAENNQDPIAIGDDETEPTNGWVLEKNEHLVLNINLTEEILYMASGQSGQTVELLGFV